MAHPPANATTHVEPMAPSTGFLHWIKVRLLCESATRAAIAADHEMVFPSPVHYRTSTVSTEQVPDEITQRYEASTRDAGRVPSGQAPMPTVSAVRVRQDVDPAGTRTTVERPRSRLTIPDELDERRSVPIPYSQGQDHVHAARVPIRYQPSPEDTVARGRAHRRARADAAGSAEDLFAGAQGPNGTHGIDLPVQLGLGQARVNQITALMRYQHSSSDGNMDQCTICLEDFCPGETLRVLPCFHRYHRCCIDQWLRKSVACPICKHELQDGE